MERRSRHECGRVALVFAGACTRRARPSDMLLISSPAGRCRATFDFVCVPLVGVTPLSAYSNETHRAWHPPQEILNIGISQPQPHPPPTSKRRGCPPAKHRYVEICLSYLGTEREGQHTSSHTPSGVENTVCAFVLCMCKEFRRKSTREAFCIPKMYLRLASGSAELGR